MCINSINTYIRVQNKQSEMVRVRTRAMVQDMMSRLQVRLQLREILDVE